MSSIRIDEFHNSTPIHQFYAQNIDYSSSLRKCFSKKHLFHLQNPIKNEVYQCLASSGFWAGLELAKSDLFFKLRNEITSNIKLKKDEQYAIHSLETNEVKDIGALLLTQPLITEAITHYLGGSYLIHECYLFLRRKCSDNEKIQTSGFWHRDAMGTRLKLFICLDNTNGTPGTSIVGHPYLDPVPHLWEMIRANEPSHELPEMKKLNEMITNFNPQTIDLNPGQVLLLDTNSVHRGEYSGNKLKKNIEYTSVNTRTFIVLSFISAEAYALYSKTNKRPYAHEHTRVYKELIKNMKLASPPFFALENC